MFTNSFKTAVNDWRVSISQGMMGPMMPKSQIPTRRRQVSQRQLRGMTLVELLVTVSITGILATAGTVSFREQVNKSHSVEAVAMLGSMRQAISVAGLDSVNADKDLNFARTTFGNAKSNGKGNNKTPDSETDPTDIELSGSKSNNGHGNNEGGCDPSNPGNGGKCDGSPTDSGSSSSGSDSSSSGNGNSGNNGNNGNNGNGSNKDGGIDGDGNNGHGNNPDGCDPDNPGNGGKCGGDEGSDTSTDNSGSGDSGSGDSGSGDSGSTDSGSDGSGTTDPGSDDDATDGGGSTDGSGSGSIGIQSLCDSASPVPASLDNVRAKVYNAPSSAWSSGTSNSGWSCLRISHAGNQRYQFGYDKGAGTISGSEEGFTAWARGDLDGDGRNSLFRVRGDLVNGTVVHSPGVEIIDGTE
jgi:prepilin-type N-terminal cleavage/methylation domain-containing protein